jgi:hypothetical protein
MKNRLFAVAITLTLALVYGVTARAQVIPPQGRLTLQSNTPVMTSDVTGATTIYYTPYIGNSLVVSNGTSLSNQVFSELSLPLSGVVAADQIADFYAINVSGTFHLCLANGWTNLGSRSTAGAPILWQGLWVNPSTLNYCQDAHAGYTLAPKTAIYLGSAYTSPNDAMPSTVLGVTVSLHPAAAPGGSGNMIGLWNAYNRVPVTAMCMDSTSSWTYGTNIARAANNSPNNRISFLDGLQQSSFTASYSVAMANSGTGNAIVGIGVDTSTVINVPWAQTGGTFLLNPVATFTSYPMIGLHSVQAMEQVFSGTETFDGAGAYQALTLSLTM